MIGIRIDNDPELKIEDAMQVKGRCARMDTASSDGAITKDDRKLLPKLWAAPNPWARKRPR
jgi:hypothetical protein